MRDAADVGRKNGVGRLLAKGFAQHTELAVAQLVGEVRVEHRIGARRATAQVGFVACHAQLEAQLVQVRLYPAAQLLAMLQGARRVVGKQHVGGLHAAGQFLRQLGQQRGQQLRQVAREGADALGFGGVVRVILEDVAVFLDGDAAARGVHDNGFHTARLHQRPPGIDVGAHLGLAAFLVVEVELDGTAAARLGRDHGLDARGVQHAGGGGVDVGHHGRLHAARQHEHLARMFASGPGPCLLRRGHLGLEGFGQQAAHCLAHLHGGGKQGRWQALFQRPAQGLFAQGTGHFFVHQLAPDVDQVAILHAAGAGAFAVAASEAPVQMHLRLARGRLAFEHLFDEVDAAARAIQLVAQQLVGGAGCRAETAVHAFAHDGFGLQAIGAGAVFRGELGLHGCSLDRSTEKIRGRGATGQARPCAADGAGAPGRPTAGAATGPAAPAPVAPQTQNPHA